MNLIKKLTIVYFLISFIPLVILIGILYFYSQKIFIDQEFTFLQQISDVKISRINEFYKKLNDDMRIIQKYYNIRSNFPVLTRYRNTPQGQEYVNAKSQLDEQLSAWFGTRTDVEDIMLVDQNGIVFYTANPFNQDRYLNKKLENTQEDLLSTDSKSVAISDLLQEDTSSGRVFLLVQAPIFDLLKKEKAFVILKIRANLLYQLIQDTSGLGKTGETLIAKVYHDSAQDKDYILYLNPLRNDPDSAFNRKVFFNQPNSIPLQRAAMKENGFGMGVDYRSQQVLAAWRYLPDQSWAFVAKIDKSEASVVVHKLASYSILLALLLSVILAISIGYFSKKITDPIKLLADIADKIAKGDFNSKNSILSNSSKDEIGVLGRSIENMRINLISSYSSLEQKVRDRTQELGNARIAVSNVLEDLTIEKTRVDLAKAKDEAMLNSIGDGLIITDKEGKIVMVNPPAEKMIGWNIQDLLGKPIFEAIPMEDEKNEFIPAVQRALNMALSGTSTTTTTTTTSSSSEGSTRVATVYFIRKDKTKFPAAASTAPVRHADGSIEGAVVVFRDITKEKESDKAKTEFVSLSSHQLRTPLTSINWYSEMLSSPDIGSLNEAQKTYVEEIANSSKRMVKLVAALLDISRIEFGTFAIEPKPINLKEITEIYLKELEPEILKKKLKFTAIYDPSLPIIQADPKLLGMILTNLLTNSVKYTPAGGQIKLSIDKGESDITMAVSDTGLGIPKEGQSEVFKKLFRADNIREVDPEGTGLGLYIVKGIVDQAGGKIRFESQEGKGTTFYVTFPLSGMQEKEGTKKLS